jgi:hypothetical protein
MIIKSYIPFSHVNGFQTANPGAGTLVNQWLQHNNPEQLTYASVTDAFPEKQHNKSKNTAGLPQKLQDISKQFWSLKSGMELRMELLCIQQQLYSQH